VKFLKLGDWILGQYRVIWVRIFSDEMYSWTFRNSRIRDVLFVPMGIGRLLRCRSSIIAPL
jgi:hypothetical protein